MSTGQENISTISRASLNAESCSFEDRCQIGISPTKSIEGTVSRTSATEFQSLQNGSDSGSSTAEVSPGSSRASRASSGGKTVPGQTTVQSQQYVITNPAFKGGDAYLTPHIQHQTVVVVGGNCPNCHTGYIEEEYTCFGLLLAIFFFPIGIACCWLLRQRICTTCGVVFRS